MTEPKPEPEPMPVGEPEAPVGPAVPADVEPIGS